MKHKEVTERDGERKQDANTHSKKREKGTTFFSFSVSFGFMWCNLSLIKKKWVHMMTTNRLYRGGDVTCTMRVTSTTKAVRKVGANRNHKTAIRQA